MMDMIRSWRIVPVAAWPRVTMEILRGGIRAITSPKMRSFATWSVAVILIGLLTGAMAVILPPLASIGVVALIGVVLLWAMPDLHIVPDTLLRKMFYWMVAVQLCVPAYYAIDTGILPWISVRRLFLLAVILLFALTVASSQSARNKIADTMRNNRLLAFLTLGFLTMLFISIFTARYPTRSLTGLFDVFLTWYVPFFACIFVVRTEEDVILLMKIVVAACIFDSVLGVAEFFLQRRFYFDIFPKSVLDAMLSSNPALQTMYSAPQFRNGIYRASSIYTVPLSFGELVAMAAPVGAYFIFHGENMKWRLLGIASLVSAFAGLLVSGARGGFISFLAAMPVMLVLWTIRYSKENRGSIVGALMGAIFSTGFIAALGLIAFSTKLSNIVLGGGDTAGSTDARFVQFNMAVPHILANPVTGHGPGSAAELVGYYTLGGTVPTVDSFIITLLVEQGVPGLLLFFGMLIFGIWIGVRLYLTDLDNRAAVGGPIACSIIAFAVYRLVLSQGENHTLLFLMIGIVFAISNLSRDRKREVGSLNSTSPNFSVWQRPLGESGASAHISRRRDLP